MSLAIKLKGISATSALTVFGMLGAANAATYTPDTLLGPAHLGRSGDGVELAALATVAGVDVSTLSVERKIETGAFSIDDAGNYVVDVSPNTPGYFILKFGVGVASAVSHYFFPEHCGSDQACLDG